MWKDSEGKEPVKIVLANLVRFAFAVISSEWAPVVTGGRGGRAVYQLSDEQCDAINAPV